MPLRRPAPILALMDFRSGEAMMAFDAALRVLEWNEAAVELTGIPADDALGRRCWEVLRAADERGSLVCHAGCSYARLAREGWQVPTRKLWTRTRDGKRLLSVTTVTVREGAEPVFLHLMRNGDAPCEEVEDERPSLTLTARQQQVLSLLAEGVPAKAIAARLGLAQPTVRNHIRGVLVALGAHSQLEAVATARRLRLLA